MLCKYCGFNGIESDFYSCNMCLSCRKVRNKNASKLARRKLYSRDKDKIIAINKEYYQNNKDKKKEYDKEYWISNKTKRLAQATANHLRRLKEDPAYKLRSIVSTSICRELKSNNSSKNGNSILKFLPYSAQELKSHLEKLFEPWMTWQNYGTYRVDIWNDQDPSTWTWQLDHIVPHSKFKYSSMEEQAFRDCWSLENLRPYSAKQNIIDGDR